MPSDANFLIGCPSSVGLESFRREGVGSWYISTLCKVLEEEAHRSHLLEIMTEVMILPQTLRHDYIIAQVARRVAEMTTSKGKKQMPQLQSTLLSKFYFISKE